MSDTSDDAGALWRGALHAIDSQLDDIERALAADDWSWSWPARSRWPRAPLPPDLRADAERAQARIEALERRLTGELRTTRRALVDLEARRQAAKNYHRSVATTSVTRRGDD